MRKRPIEKDGAKASGVSSGRQSAATEPRRRTNTKKSTGNKSATALEQLQNRNNELLRLSDDLRKERDFLSAILDAAEGLLVVVLSPEGQIVRFNRVCQQLTGYSQKEVEGHLGWDLLLLPDELAGVKEAFRKLSTVTHTRHENHWVTKDGRRLLVSWSNTAGGSPGAEGFVIATGIDITGREEAEERAREGEATVRALLETASQAIFAIDQQGRIAFANAAAEKIFGYRRHELVGQPVGKLLPERFARGRAGHMAKWFSKLVQQHMGAGRDLFGRRKDGSEFPCEISLSSIETHHGTVGFTFLSDITDRKKNEAALFNYQRQLQQLTANLITSQEHANRALARELHDVFSQELAAASMEISALQEAVQQTPAKLRPRLAALGKKIARLAEEIHDTSRRLHPSILDDLGLEAALREECRGFFERYRVPVEFLPDKVPASIPAVVSLCLFRVAQESLRNVGKHARANQVRARLTGSRTGITLRIEDEGDGFELDHALRKGGLGFISMDERVRLVGGRLDIQSRVGKGTTVTAFVPLKVGS